MAQTPQHVPYHEAARKTFKRPPCSTAGLAPWRLPDGSGFNVVKHVVVDDASRISDVIGQWRRSVNGEQVFIGLQPWQPGQPMPPILDVESDCNSGKSHGVFFKMIRELLLNDPTIPLLFFSVRITHAYDLFETLTQRYFVDDSGNPIGNLVCYKDGEDGVKERCKKATQLVISPQTAALDCLGNLERFTRGILVLDEAVSFALSLGVASNSGRATIKDPDLLINIFHRLAQIMPHVIVMDRDLTLTPIASKMQALLFPKRDVIHVQLERPAQRNSFCYTFGTKEHAKAGRGAPLALALFKLHALRCKETFEGTPDDGSDTGPTEWKRLWVVAGSKQYAEIVLLPILRQLGVKFRFYHAGSRDAKHPRGGAPSKQDLREPNQKWKHFHVIVATTTIEVAVNVTLPFLARWLFTCASESSSASELMQTVARVPRGTPEEQHAQLEDAAIYTLFAGNPPLVDAAPKPKHTDLQAIEKKAQDLTEAGWQSRQVELRATAARLRVYHESSAEPVPQLSMPYNELRASTMLYRQDHRGREHVRRFFEVADKGYFESQVYWMEADNNGDPPIGGEEIRNCPELLQLIEDEDPRASRRSDIEDLLGYRLRPEHYIEGGGHDHQPGERYYQPFISPAEEMPKLTSEQKSKLAEIDGTEYDPLDEDVDTRANNLPTDDKAKFELLINCMDRMALGMVQQCNRDLGGDEHEVDNQAFVEMLESVRANFMHDCNGVRPNPENSSYQNMQLEIYDTLRTYSFGKFTDGGARNAIKYLVTYESDEERRDVEEQVDYDLLRDDERPAGVAGEIYRRLAEASKGAAPSRLAQLRVLSLNRILADGRRKVDRTYTPQRELGSNSHLARQ